MREGTRIRLYEGGFDNLSNECRLAATVRDTITYNRPL